MSNTVTAYQTLEDRGNRDVVELDGPFECRRDNAWLGFGYYFWDTDIEWAHFWGKTAYGDENYFVGNCEISLEHCFDLVGSVQHRMALDEVIAVMKLENLINGPVVLTTVIEFMKQNNLFPYKLIRSQDIPNRAKRLKFNKFRKEYMILNQRVQICVIDKKDVLLSEFSVVYPENP